ncbi:dTDP-4-dehydrorhamnose reductase [Prochlorococcus sp. AH-736-E15]|nr:dTDP-4-dehydrorhamnose reductase [Prochlorococcus sp. AH-736-E15]
MKILLTGSTGQLGQAIILQKPKDHQILLPKRNELDLSDHLSCKKYIEFNKPDLIINCGAYTNVDLAEKEKELCYAINTSAPVTFAKILNDYGGNLLQISTDYVFDGQKNYAYKENDERNPISQYGYSKAKAEELLEKILKPKNQLIILRTSWLLSPTGKNFLIKILNLHKTKKEFFVVSDQIGTMSSAFDVANICWQIIGKWNLVSNNNFINHWSCSGISSWYDIAINIGDIAQKHKIIDSPAILKPIKTENYSTPAKRPLFSLLDCEKTSNTLNITRKYWQYELETIISKIANKK